MNIRRISFMSEKLPSNQLDSDDFYLNTEDTDYKNLIIRLKDIGETIALLEKTLFK